MLINLLYVNMVLQLKTWNLTAASYFVRLYCLCESGYIWMVFAFVYFVKVTFQCTSYYVWHSVVSDTTLFVQIVLFNYTIFNIGFFFGLGGEWLLGGWERNWKNMVCHLCKCKLSNSYKIIKVLTCVASSQPHPLSRLCCLITP